MLTCVSFGEIKEYLRELSCGRTDRQTEVINTFQLSLESVKNENGTKIIEREYNKLMFF
jgi:hypothetical protein